jgi:hypothetical protein
MFAVLRQAGSEAAAASARLSEVSGGLLRRGETGETVKHIQKGPSHRRPFNGESVSPERAYGETVKRTGRFTCFLG